MCVCECRKKWRAEKLRRAHKKQCSLNYKVENVEEHGNSTEIYNTHIIHDMIVSSAPFAQIWASLFFPSAVLCSVAECCWFCYHYNRNLFISLCVCVCFSSEYFFCSVRWKNSQWYYEYSANRSQYLYIHTYILLCCFFPRSNLGCVCMFFFQHT